MFSRSIDEFSRVQDAALSYEFIRSKNPSDTNFLMDIELTEDEQFTFDVLQESLLSYSHDDLLDLISVASVARFYRDDKESDISEGDNYNSQEYFERYKENWKPLDKVQLMEQLSSYKKLSYYIFLGFELLLQTK